MRTRDVATGVACLALALGWGWLTAGLPERSLPNTPGPAFFPWVVTVSLALLASALVVRGLIGPSDSANEEAGSRGVRPAIVLMLLGAFTLYIAVLPRLGFLIATAPFFAALMVLYDERRPVVVIAGSLLATAGLYLLFRHGFQIILPLGVLRGVVP